MDAPHPRQPDAAAAVRDQVAAAYDGNAAPRLDAVANPQVLMELIGDPAGKAICEAGSGIGQASARLALSGADTTMVDISPRAPELARERFAELGPAGRLCMPDGCRLGSRDGCFDVVWSGGIRACRLSQLGRLSASLP